jgi:hypothetical protein
MYNNIACNYQLPKELPFIQGSHVNNDYKTDLHTKYSTKLKSGETFKFNGHEFQPNLFFYFATRS